MLSGLNNRNTSPSSASPPSRVDPVKDLYLRVERQIMTRLERTGTIVFSVKTFLTPLSEIKEEGLGEELLAAVNSMPECLARYKIRSFWLKEVTAFLRDK